MNGPGTCLLVAVWATVLSIVPGRCRPHVVFVESIARVDDISLTGRLLMAFRLTTAFFVQWDRALPAAPRATLLPRIY